MTHSDDPGTGSGPDIGKAAPPSGAAGDRDLPFSGRIAVIDALGLLPARTLLSEDVDLVPLPFAGLTPDRLRRAEAQLVAAPLVGKGYDILDILALVRRAGHAGPVAALTRPVTLPGDMRITIREHAGDLPVYVVQVGAGGDILALDRVTA